MIVPATLPYIASEDLPKLVNLLEILTDDGKKPVRYWTIQKEVGNRSRWKSYGYYFEIHGLRYYSLVDIDLDLLIMIGVLKPDKEDRFLYRLDATNWDKYAVQFL